MELTLGSGLHIASVVAALSLFASGPVAAQDAKPALNLELNNAAQFDSGCRLTFVARNDLAADLSKVVFEFALFGKTGLVERLLTLDFKELPQGRTRVRQFDLADMRCAALARVLVNDARECTGKGLEPSACMDNLQTKTVTEMEFGS